MRTPMKQFYNAIRCEDVSRVSPSSCTYDPLQKSSYAIKLTLWSPSPVVLHDKTGLWLYQIFRLPRNILAPPTAIDQRTAQRGGRRTLRAPFAQLWAAVQSLAGSSTEADTRIALLALDGAGSPSNANECRKAQTKSSLYDRLMKHSRYITDVHHVEQPRLLELFASLMPQLHALDKTDTCPASKSAKAISHGDRPY